MTNTSDRACAHESDPVALLHAEWRRTGMPSGLQRAVDGSISVSFGPGARARITSPLAVAAVLQHLPAANAADEVAVAVMQRVVLVRDERDYPVSAAVLDVLWPRVMLVLRKEFLAFRLFAGAQRERSKLDAYVAALEAMMTTTESGNLPREIGDGDARTGLAGTNVNVVSPEIGEQVALLSYAEWIRRGAAPATVEFWGLVCEELANDLRAALAELGQGALRRPPTAIKPGYLPTRLALLGDAELIRARSPAATVSFWDVFQGLVEIIRTALADLEQEGSHREVSSVGDHPGGGLPAGRDREDGRASGAGPRYGAAPQGRGDASPWGEVRRG